MQFMQALKSTGLKTEALAIDMAITRRQIIDEALDWIGTPYQHQCSHKHQACDCLGLVRGVWRAIYKNEPATIPPYTPDWAEQGQEEVLLNAARKYLVPIEIAKIKPADVLVFRMQEGVIAKHMAILLDDDLIVHAYWGRAVTRSFLSPFWSRRLVASFAFPNLED